MDSCDTFRDTFFESRRDCGNRQTRGHSQPALS
jgi:hypothetical protein